MRLFLHLFFLVAMGLSTRAADVLPGVKRILFLGDSITASGQYVDGFELFLAVRHPERDITVINCGLPSETVSGLSEAGHAGGKFPRPDLHERLDRVLALVKPDLVFACYGMNCGIYLPLDEGRFAKYREGIEKLRAKVKAAGADIIHLTPAMFDSLPIRDRVVPAVGIKDGQMYEGYDDVLTAYSEWLLKQRKEQGWKVVDTHFVMHTAVTAGRKAQADFTFAKDGVHPNDLGHHAMTVSILRQLDTDFDPDNAKYAELRKLVRARGRVLAESYLNTAGHQRPGMGKGLPVPEAEAKAGELTRQIKEKAAALEAAK